MEYQSFPNERRLLRAFFSIVRQYDPDAFVGWNLVGFDLQWLYRKCIALSIGFDIGTDGSTEMLEPGKTSINGSPGSRVGLRWTGSP